MGTETLLCRCIRKQGNQTDNAAKCYYIIGRMKLMEQNMENTYIEELITTMECTEICHGNYEEVKCGSYNERISLLVDMFTVHKEKRTQLFFIGNGAVR